MKILLRIAAIAATTILLVLSSLYAASERRLARHYDVPLTPLRIAPANALVAEGERRAHIFGCTGCHHEAGNVLFRALGVGRLVAPNLTRVVPLYTDAELVRLVRHGVKRDGTSVIAMPAAALNGLSDEDLASIVAWLRTRPRLADAQPAQTAWGPLGWLAIAAGKVPFSAPRVREVAPPLARPRAAPGQQGAYLVQSICSDCHKLDEVSDNGWGMRAPPLRMMGQAYSLADFRTLMRTGKAMDNRELGTMSSIARGDLSHMTDTEIDAIHAYLNSSDKSGSIAAVNAQ